jgi:hypothetical protein
LVAESKNAERIDALLVFDNKDISRLLDAIIYRIRRIWNQVLPGPVYPEQSRAGEEAPEFAERLPSPWRLQFLLQEAIDSFFFRKRYFQHQIPAPTESSLGQLPLPEHWSSYCREHTPEAAALLATYAERVLDNFAKSAARLLVEAVGDDVTTEACNAVLALTAPIDRDPPPELIKKLALGDLLRSTADAWYINKTRYSGDMDMVNYWSRHGIVVPRATIPGTEPVAFVETERDQYDGLNYADYFHILQNPDSFTGVSELANVIADRVLNRAKQLIEDTKEDQGFIETVFPYSPELFEAKMEEIYEYYRNLAQNPKPWMTPRTRNEMIQGILQLAPFNQLDGAWLRFTADAGEIDPIHGLLFEIWRDEVGNGNPAEHHGNLYTTLMRSLGFAPPDVSTREYTEWFTQVGSPLAFTDDNFVSPVFELAISTHSKKYFPEILGMTLFLEWEVLELAPGVHRWDYMGIDPKFLRMHVGIDNAVDGHGAKAKVAVRDYLEQVRKEGGEEAVQEQWSRIWRGFVAFAAPMDNYFPDEFRVSGRRLPNVEERLVALIGRKRAYASRNHGNKQLGAEKINDLFEYPAELLAELSASQWIVPGHPELSLFLKHLTTYNGPMYKVFNEKELDLWSEWIVWLGKSGNTERPREVISNSDAMLRLLELMRNSASGSLGHARLKIKGRTISDWFAEPDLRRLMAALRDDKTGWVVPGDADTSALVVDQLRGDRVMGRALDRRFPELHDQIGRLVIIQWINAGCPIPGEEELVVTKAPYILPGSLRPERQTLVQAFGQGSVH